MSQDISDFGGLKVPFARDEIIRNLLKSKKGDVMYDFSEKPVICRCGTESVVEYSRTNGSLNIQMKNGKKSHIIA